MSMPPFLGQILRVIGLLIEFLGIVGLATQDPTSEGLLDRIFGKHSRSFLWGIVVAGFLVWLVGSILIYTTRPRPSTSEPDTR
jgi:hypothetical protein